MKSICGRWCKLKNIFANPPWIRFSIFHTYFSVLVLRLSTCYILSWKNSHTSPIVYMSWTNGNHLCQIIITAFTQTLYNCKSQWFALIHYKQSTATHSKIFFRLWLLYIYLSFRWILFAIAIILFHVVKEKNKSHMNRRIKIYALRMLIGDFNINKW